MATVIQTDTAQPRRRRLLGEHVPMEGENGLYTQSWFPICMSSDIGAGEVKGFPFLGGRVITFRGADGAAQVTSAYCPHLGADISVGKVVGNHVQCPYHMWEFNRDGICQKTGSGDPAPRRASLFAFPTQEKHGLIWAFNGEEPWFEIPNWPFSDADVLTDTQEFPVPMNIDPWIICAQTPDIQHLLYLHKFDLKGPNPEGNVAWTDHSMFYDMDGLWGGRRMTIRAGIVGTSIFFQTGTLDGRWFGFMTGMGLPAPSQSRMFSVFAAERTEDEDEVRAFLEEARLHEIAIAMEDSAIGQTIHFRVGSLTRADATLARFLDYMRRFPRAHPSAEFID